jgi:uncharacterized protein (TIGR02677 family)
MGAFAAAKRRFQVHLRPEDVQHHLRAGGDTPDSATIVDALGQLRDWGNLRADPDTSRVTSVEEFHRVRFLYQLTREGEAAETALAAYDLALGRRGALQSVALTDIVLQLRALLELVTAPEPDAARVHLSLSALAARFQDLADNAQAFMTSLQRTMDVRDADVDAFLAYKDRLIDYLERFIKDLVATGAEIAQLVIRLEEFDVPALLDLAAEREAADEAPDGTADFRARAFARQRELWSERWAGFHAWFLSAAGQQSQAAILRGQARAAVPRLLAVVSALNDRRAGRSDRSADFRTLALWFAEAPDDAAMHRLWRAAFGLQSTRHLTITPETVQAREDRRIAGTTAWADAPPILISPRLRKTGSYERRGKPNRVIDRSQQLRYLAERAAAQAAETAAARAALLAKVGVAVRLSDVSTLEPGAFRLFLGLLGDALAAATPGQSEVRTVTADGSLAVRLVALPDPEIAEIDTGAGIFRGPDHLLQITDMVAVRRRDAAS